MSERTWPQRPKTDQRVIYNTHGRPVPEDGSPTPVNWVGDDYPPAAIPGLDTWNGEPITEAMAWRHR